MMPTKTLNFSLIIIFLSITSAFGQIPSAETTACNPKMAQALVEQQVAESKSVVERPKRIKILLRSGDFLWVVDQSRAREYFTEAYKTAAEHFAANGFEKKDIKKTGSGGGSVWSSLPDQRTEVIKAVSKRDPELARKFTEQMLADYDKAAADRDQLDTDRELSDLMRFAVETIKTNPDVSRQMFRRVMRYPLIQNWFFILNQAAGQDQTFTDSIYLEALRNYANEKPHLLLYLSGYPFGRDRPYGASRFSGGLPDGFVPNLNLQQVFLDIFFTRIGTFAANADETTRPADKYESPEAVYMVTSLREFEPILIERFPDLLQRFSVAQSQANALLTADMQKDITSRDKQATASALTFDERLKQFEEADVKGTLTDSMLGQMIFPGRINKEEEYKRFESWLLRIQDEKLRADVTSYFWFLRCQLAIKEARYAEAEKMAAKVPELDHRSLLLFDIAKKQLDSINDQGSAFDTLNGVSKLTRSAPNSVAKARVLLSLVQLYDRLNHTVALDELGEAIRVINQLDDPDLFDNYITRQIVGKDFASMASLPLPGGNFESLFTDMGKKDFEMSLANARALNDKYFRTIAVLAIAKNCVQLKPPAITKKAK